MPLPVIDKVYRVTFNWTGGPNPPEANNVIHLHDAGSHTLDTVGSDLLDVLADTDVANLGNPIKDTYSLGSVDILPLDGVTATRHFDVSPGDIITGASGGDVVPQVACVVSFATAVRGRRSRGRVFLGPCGESAIADGLVAFARQELVAASWAAFTTGLADHNIPLQVTSYRGHTTHDVTHVSVRAHTGTVRRRNHR